MGLSKTGVALSDKEIFSRPVSPIFSSSGSNVKLGEHGVVTVPAEFKTSDVVDSCGLESENQRIVKPGHYLHLIHEIRRGAASVSALIESKAVIYVSTGQVKQDRLARSYPNIGDIAVRKTVAVTRACACIRPIRGIAHSPRKLLPGNINRKIGMHFRMRVRIGKKRRGNQGKDNQNGED